MTRLFYLAMILAPYVGRALRWGLMGFLALVMIATILRTFGL